jgi:hypothetical protein
VGQFATKILVVERRSEGYRFTFNLITFVATVQMVSSSADHNEYCRNTMHQLYIYIYLHHRLLFSLILQI